MEERKEIVNVYVQRGLKVTKAAEIAGFSRSCYYYKSQGGIRGRRPSSQSLKVDGSLVDNEEIVETIKEIIIDDFIDYGYEKVTAELRKRGYIINKKKVYRLMKENRLLNTKKKPVGRLKTYVEHSQPCPAQPFEMLEIDIKYIYIRGDRRNAYLITILDTFNRKALVWDLSYSMKSIRVIKLVDRLILQYLQPEDLLNRKISVTLRSDNGSQFIAKVLRKHLEQNHIFQQFIKPATPEQNGHIESFHSTVEKLVCQKFEFNSIYHARTIFERFFDTYNGKRILKCLLYNTPNEFGDLWYNQKIAVSYSLKNKKQHFFFREKQWLSPVLLPSRRFVDCGFDKNIKIKNNLYICEQN